MIDSSRSVTRVVKVQQKTYVASGRCAGRGGGLVSEGGAGAPGGRARHPRWSLELHSRFAIKVPALDSTSIIFLSLRPGREFCIVTGVEVDDAGSLEINILGARDIAFARNEAALFNHAVAQPGYRPSIKRAGSASTAARRGHGRSGCVNVRRALFLLIAYCERQGSGPIVQGRSSAADNRGSSSVTRLKNARGGSLATAPGIVLAGVPGALRVSEVRRSNAGFIQKAQPFAPRLDR